MRALGPARQRHLSTHLSMARLRRLRCASCTATLPQTFARPVIRRPRLETSHDDYTTFCEWWGGKRTRSSTRGPSRPIPGHLSRARPQVSSLSRLRHLQRELPSRTVTPFHTSTRTSRAYHLAWLDVGESRCLFCVEKLRSYRAWHGGGEGARGGNGLERSCSGA
ncbi:hypothetical protein B0T22DRAFT_39092 [Podospora appendiculata]|uniref:Uncharacterized protein n=1 Tax=Podospora appendiculata TaxID=314037 RepID=A0AAE0XH80_9PEZI|nr:hypothetical protein B0T22DRAFT_39092 [Podospora appendiculata]